MTINPSSKRGSSGKHGSNMDKNIERIYYGETKLPSVTEFEKQPSFYDLDQGEGEEVSLTKKHWKNGLITNPRKVEKDFKETEKIKKDFDNEDKAAKVLEVFLNHTIEMQDWFGKDAKSIKTTDYDDIHNKIDTVIEWGNENGEKIRLGIDFTSSSNKEDVDKKLEEIKDELDGERNGNNEERKGEYLGGVKYYVSPHELDNTFNEQEVEEKMESLDSVPHVVVGMDRNRIEKLAEDMEEDKMNEKHPARIAILEQIQKQLEVQVEYLLNNFRRELIALVDKDTFEKVSNRTLKTEDLDVVIQNIDDVKSEVDEEDVKKQARAIVNLSKTLSKVKKLHSNIKNSLNKTKLDEAESNWVKHNKTSGYLDQFQL